MSVNSVAVLRLMGKGSGAAPAGVSRGRGNTRSRGMEAQRCLEGAGHVPFSFLGTERMAAPPPLKFCPSIKQAVAVAKVAFTKEVLRRWKEHLDVAELGRYTGARVGMTGE